MLCKIIFFPAYFFSNSNSDVGLKKLVFTLLGTSLLFASCKKDEEAPTITVMAPSDPAELSPGDEVHTEIMFSDNEALASYEVHIANEDGSHNHDFEFEKEGSISGTEYEFHEHFDVPDSIALGHYHLEIMVTDQEGNTNSETVELHVE